MCSNLSITKELETSNSFYDDTCEGIKKKKKQEYKQKWLRSLLSMLKPFKCSNTGNPSQMWLSKVEIPAEYGCIVSYFATLIGTFSWDAEAKAYMMTYDKQLKISLLCMTRKISSGKWGMRR